MAKNKPLDPVDLEQIQDDIVLASNSVINTNTIIDTLELDGYLKVTFQSKDRDKYADMKVDLSEPELRAIANRFAKEVKTYWLEQLEAGNSQLKEAINDERKT